MNQFKISEINVNLWNKRNVSFVPHSDVNIIVGINGSGKTTLLNEIEKIARLRLENEESCIYIPSVDNLQARDKRQKATPLSQALDAYIYDMKSGPSLMYYRMSMLDASLSQQSRVRERIHNFCSLINSLFSDTGKHIEVEGNKFLIYSDGILLPTDSLSSGEKQILLTLLRVFLLDERDSVILIDEPENSLDISWQYKLVDILVKLNPNAQYFITTHSPSIFSDGWGNNIIYMEDVTTPTDKSL
ncbi:MAG: ATP-binding protein [Duncaniella sp.]|nr:ATP-binding protein [Duncaniella sp.]